MDQNIESILEDLYSLDPSLRERSDELENLVAKLLELKPDITIDEQFAQGLRAELAEKAERMSLEESKEESEEESGGFLFVFKRIALGLGGVAVTAVIVLSVVNLDMTPKFSSPNQEMFDAEPMVARQLADEDGLSGETEEAAVAEIAMVPQTENVSATGIEIPLVKVGGGGVGDLVLDEGVTTEPVPEPIVAKSTSTTETIVLEGASGGGGEGAMPASEPVADFSEEVMVMAMPAPPMDAVMDAAEPSYVFEAVSPTEPKFVTQGCAQYEAFHQKLMAGLVEKQVQPLVAGYTIYRSLNHENWTVDEALAVNVCQSDPSQAQITHTSAGYLFWSQPAF